MAEVILNVTYEDIVSGKADRLLQERRRKLMDGILGIVEVSTELLCDASGANYSAAKLHELAPGTPLYWSKPEADEPVIR